MLPDGSIFHFKLLFECNAAIVDEVANRVSHHAHECGYSVTGYHEKAKVVFHIAESRLVERPHNGELHTVANGETYQKQHHLTAKSTVGVENELSVPYKGIGHTGNISCRIRYIIIDAKH